MFQCNLCDQLWFKPTTSNDVQKAKKIFRHDSILFTSHDRNTNYIYDFTCITRGHIPIYNVSNNVKKYFEIICSVFYVLIKILLFLLIKRIVISRPIASQECSTRKRSVETFHFAKFGGKMTTDIWQTFLYALIRLKLSFSHTSFQQYVFTEGESAIFSIP